MTILWGEAASPRLSPGEPRILRRALGAAERRHWASLIRQGDIDTVQKLLTQPQLYGAVVIGPRGVGKTTLARSISDRIGTTSHVIRLFASGAYSEVPYSLFSFQLARLSERETESPPAVLNALVGQIFTAAHGKPITIVLDDLPGIDTFSMAVLMHLVLSGKAKLLVAARSVSELPEDLLWMIKDGLLAQHRLGLFSRTEVRELLVKALNGPVAESVVASLHATSAGNPLVLQVLVHEYLSSGVLRINTGVWVAVDQLAGHSDDVLLEMVESRLARETASVRSNIEMLSLLNHAPLAVVIQVLGAEVVAALEERGFLSFPVGRQKTVTFAEPYFGETVRNSLLPAKKAALFENLHNVVVPDPAVLSRQELLMLASWMNEAGMELDPETAIAAARAALHFVNPVLALECASRVPGDHRLAVPAAQQCSRAYYIMANYSRASKILEDVDPDTLARCSTQEYAAWAMDLCVALLWQVGTDARIVEVLDQVKQRIGQAPMDERAEAEKFYNLARFEVHINRGEFSTVLAELKIASNDSNDRDYRLNCASMLTLALAATGSQVDAVELSEAIDAEMVLHDVSLRMNDWQLYGRILGLLWSGQWRDCEAVLLQKIQYSSSSLYYRGGAMELALGVVYAFAGQDMKAAQVLMSAAAQLEVRDTYASLELAYSMLAYVYSRQGDESLSRRYLAQAGEVGPQVVWINRTLSDHFRALTLQELGEGAATVHLLRVVERDCEKERITPATMGLLAAIMSGASGHYELLETLARGCQGPLSKICLLVSGAASSGGVRDALDAANQAQALGLLELERHCISVAVECAKSSGDARLVKITSQRWRSLEPSAELPSVRGLAPLTARELQVARLAIRGLSNRDLATKIGISIRTVEGHLYQVFAKLDITSRAELEAWVDL